MRTVQIAAVILCVSALGLVRAASPQQTGRESPPPAQPGRGETGRGAAAPAFASPEVLPDRRVTFRIFAPRAEEVRLTGTDIPRNTPGAAMTKSDYGVWEVTIGPLEPGAYRYNFNVNGVSVIDPRSPVTAPPAPGS